MADKSIFKKTKHFFIDIDGTFAVDDFLLPGAAEFTRAVEESGRNFWFFTNNSSHDSLECCERLERIGFPVPEEKVIVSNHVTLDYLERFHRGQTVFLLGNERLTADFVKAGIPLVSDNPDIVVLGLDTTLTYRKMWDGVRFINNGALFIATHPDVCAPTAIGLMPDVGSLMSVFTVATGVQPLVMGKPTTIAVDFITHKFSCGRDEIAFVGDRLEADIAIGMNHGFPTALVLTGVTDLEYLAKSPIKPTVVEKGIGDLIKYL